jgi:hypothetical protein
LLIQKTINVCVARDITALVQLEKSKAGRTSNSEKTYLILENISEGIIVANSDKKSNHGITMLMKCLELKKMILYLPISQIILSYISLMKRFSFSNLPMERALNGEVTNDIDIVLWDSAKRKKNEFLLAVGL